MARGQKSGEFNRQPGYEPRLDEVTINRDIKPGPKIVLPTGNTQGPPHDRSMYKKLPYDSSSRNIRIKHR